MNNFNQLNQPHLFSFTSEIRFQKVKRFEFCGAVSSTSARKISAGVTEMSLYDVCQAIKAKATENDLNFV